MTSMDGHGKVAANLALSAAVLIILSLATASVHAQATSSSTQATSSAAAENEPGTSTDLFVMLGSDFDRPGLLPRANYNIGIGHTFGFLKKDPFGDELTFGYT